MSVQSSNDASGTNEHLSALCRELLATLSDVQRQNVISKMVEHRYAAGEAVYCQGDPADAFYIIEEGQCGIYIKSKDEPERLLVVIKAGEHFGEHALVSGGVRENTVRAKTAAILWSVEASIYENAFVSNKTNLVKEALGFYVEKGESEEESHLFSTAAVVENAEFATAWYTQMFLGNEHTNYLGVADDVGQFMLTVRREEDIYRTILWTKNGTERMCVPASEVSSLSPEDMIKCYFGLQAKTKLKKVTTSDIEQDLFKLEEMQTYGRYKFGVLYCKEGQTTEEEWFSNKDGSDEFNEFLGVLGDRINLEGWTKYKAGLDIKPSRTTGDHSVYTVFQGYEIMFHVSTLLPHRAVDPQQIERKRHLGNDIVMIIFQDSNCHVPFGPEVITSNFNHVWAVVRPVTDEHGERRYRLSVVNKGNVPAYGPQLPKVPLFSVGADSDFRDFLLAKLINGERSTYNAPAFKSKMRRTVEHLIGEIHEKFKTKVTRSSTLGKGFTPRKVEPVSPVVKKTPELSRAASELFASTSSSAALATSSLFRSIPILSKFPYQLSSFDMWGSFGRRFVLATDDGVYMYSHTQADSERLKKILEIKKVLKLRVMQSLGLMFILSSKDHVIQVYALSLLSTDPEPLTSLFDKTYKAEYFHVQTIDDVVHLLLFYKQKCSILTFVDSKFVEKESFAIPGHTDCVSVINNYVVMGIGSDFYMYDLKHGGDVTCLYKSNTRLVPLKAVHVKQNSLLLCYNTKAIPINLDGSECKDMKYEMRWNGLPLAISHMFPYVLAVTSTFVEIRTVINGKLVQTLPVKANKMLAAGHKTVYITGDNNSLTLVTIDHDSWSHGFDAAPEYVLFNNVIKDVSAAATAERARGDSVWKMSTIAPPVKDESVSQPIGEEPVVITKRYATLAAMLSTELSESNKSMISHANSVHEEICGVKSALNRKDIQGLATASSRVAAAANEVLDAMHAGIIPRIKRLESISSNIEVSEELLVPVAQVSKEYLASHHDDILEALDALMESVTKSEVHLENNIDPIDAPVDSVSKREKFMGAVAAMSDSVNTLRHTLEDDQEASDSPQTVYFLMKDVVNHFDVFQSTISDWIATEVKHINDQMAANFDKVNTSNQKLISYSYSVINAPSDRHAIRRLLHLADIYDDMLEELVFAALKKGKRILEESTDDLLALAEPAVVGTSTPPPMDAEIKDNLNIWEEASAWEDPSLVKFDSEAQPGKLIVNACTLNKLVEYMTAPQDHDVLFMPICILSLRMYTTPSKLLSKLIDRFTPPETKNITSEQLLVIRCGVLQAIDFWLTNAFSDFNQQLLEQVNSFIDTISGKNSNINVPPAWIHSIRDCIIRLSNMASTRQRMIQQDQPKTVVRMYTGRARAAQANSDGSDMSNLFKSFMVYPISTVGEIHTSMMEKLDLDASTHDNYVIVGVKYDGPSVNVTMLDGSLYVWDTMSEFDRYELRHKADVPAAVVRDAECECNTSLRSFMAAETEAITKRKIVARSVDNAFETADDREIALCLTMADSITYMSTEPWELLSLCTGTASEAKHVASMISQYNNVYLWVIDKIVCLESAKDRAVVFAKFVHVAMHLLDLRNFHSLMAVVQGLTSPPVARLKQTKKLVKSKLLTQLAELEFLLSPDDNYARYRQLLNNGSKPSVPSLSVYMHDISNINEKNQTRVLGLINVSKCRSLFDLLSEAKQHQKESFNVHTSLLLGQILRQKCIVTPAALDKELQPYLQQSLVVESDINKK